MEKLITCQIPQIQSGNRLANEYLNTKFFNIAMQHYWKQYSNTVSSHVYTQGVSSTSEIRMKMGVGVIVRHAFH